MRGPDNEKKATKSNQQTDKQQTALQETMRTTVKSQT